MITGDRGGFSAPRQRSSCGLSWVAKAPLFYRTPDNTPKSLILVPKNRSNLSVRSGLREGSPGPNYGTSLLPYTVIFPLDALVAAGAGLRRASTHLWCHHFVRYPGAWHQTWPRCWVQNRGVSIRHSCPNRPKLSELSLRDFGVLSGVLPRSSRSDSNVTADSVKHACQRRGCPEEEYRHEHSLINPLWTLGAFCCTCSAVCFARWLFGTSGAFTRK